MDSGRHQRFWGPVGPSYLPVLDAEWCALVALPQTRGPAETRNVKFRPASISEALHRVLPLTGGADVFDTLEGLSWPADRGHA